MPDARGVYEKLDFPPAPDGRPYVFANMVATIDGKTLSGTRDEPVGDLGSAVDHATMGQVERAAHGVVAGAQSVRATPVYLLPSRCYRYCISRSGDVPFESRFFTDAPERAFLVTPEDALAQGIESQTLQFGEGSVDLPAFLAFIRERHGVERLLCEGGSNLNAQLFALELIDELFLTVAPTIKLGRDVPTIADGEPLSRERMQRLDLLSCIESDSELFLRYRRKRSE